MLLILLAGRNRVQAALGAGFVGLGLPVYLIAFRRRLTLERTAPDDLDSNDPTPGS